jgi:tripartite-type tricarboxylate transporter receptor subunit TctC
MGFKLYRLDKKVKRVLLALALVCNLAVAEQPIEIVVPYPPGGATDSLGRIVSEILTENGMSTVVLNKPGADAVIGANYAAKGKPDGKTLFVGATGALDSNIAFKAQGMEYTEKTFVPIVPLANISYVLAVPASSPIRNYEQFKFYVRANPEKFNLAFWNANTANIFYDWARKENLPKPNIILYKGSGPQMIDLVGGHVPFAYDTWLAMAPQFEADKVRVIATLDRGGLAVVKKLKPGNESIAISDIHPDLNVGVWYGLWAPAGTPKATLDKMNTVINIAFKSPKYREKMELLNIKTYGGSSESLLTMQQRNLKILKRIAQDIDK